MLRLMRGGLHEVDLDLQRRLRDEAQQLRLRLDLLRHEVENHHFERTHTLALRLRLLEREDAFGVENGAGGQSAGNLDRHVPIMFIYKNRAVAHPNTRETTRRLDLLSNLSNIIFCCLKQPTRGGAAR